MDVIESQLQRIASQFKRMVVIAGVILSSVLAATAQPDSSAVKMAILPFENLSNMSGARATVMRIVTDEIQAARIPTASTELVQKSLRNNRIRDTGKLNRKQMALIAGDTDARLILMGSIEYFEESPEAQVGFSVRLLEAETGNILWADSRYASGDASLNVLGLRQIDRIDDLAKRELHQMAAALEIQYAHFNQSSVRQPTAALMIIPFINNTTTGTVNYVVSDIFLTAISQRGYRVIEPGMVEQELRSRAVLPYGEIDTASLLALGEHLDADYCVTGSINQYEVISVQEGVTVPAIEVFARVLEATTGNILWAGRIQRTGNDYATVLGIGTVLSPGRLIQLSTEELLDSIPAHSMNPQRQAPIMRSSD